MIPRLNIVAWSAKAPWAELRQIEQDLIISRALVALFSDPILKTELRFRGGTAINKLLFPEPLRYSEDIDLVRTKAERIGPMIDRIRAVLEPWLGHGVLRSKPDRTQTPLPCGRGRRIGTAAPQGRNRHARGRGIRPAARDTVHGGQPLVHWPSRDRHLLA